MEIKNVEYDLLRFKEELYCSKPLSFSKFIEEKLSTYVESIENSKASQSDSPQRLKTFWGKESSNSCELKLGFMVRFKDNHQIPPPGKIHERPVILVAEGKVKMSVQDFAKALNYDFSLSFKGILKKFPNYQKLMKSLKNAIAKFFPLSLTYNYLAVINLWLGENGEVKDTGVGFSFISLNFEGKFGRIEYRDFINKLDEKFALLENELSQEFSENSEDIKRFIEIWRPVLLKLFDILRRDGWEIVKEWLSEIYKNVDYKKTGIVAMYIDRHKQNKTRA
jgi:hypothetical protein